jgi:transcriptional regulator with XRE-family HTH domain
MTEMDVAGALRRIRRVADLSQRELAAACGVAPAVVAKAETGARDLPVRLLLRFATVAGFQLALVDEAGSVVTPMRSDTVRDAAGRLFPAHLDTRHGDEDWWGGPHRPRLPNPRYTFDRSRACRDAGRRSAPVPADHHLPEPGDSLADRAAARREEALRRHGARQEAERRARLATSGASAPDWGTGCTCPPGCEYAEESNEDLTHAPGCACTCDVD